MYLYGSLGMPLQQLNQWYISALVSSFQDIEQPHENFVTVIVILKYEAIHFD